MPPSEETVQPALPPAPPSVLYRNGTIEYPVHHMRGGTSTGLVLWDRLAPTNLSLREELLRLLMGVPAAGRLPGNRQITGLGRGPATSNKVFFADIDEVDGQTQLISTLAQLAADHPTVDWSVNCGNMSSALQLWAHDTGMAQGEEIVIRNTNTGVMTRSRMKRLADGRFDSAEIAGVPGAFPGVDLFLQRPTRAKTGKLLPTGQPVDWIEGRWVTCLDVAVPMIIARASDFGKTGYEPPAALYADDAFMAALRATWVGAGLHMGLSKRDGSLMTAQELLHSETIPKICIVAPPQHGGQITVRYFTPQTAHASMAVSGGCCLAAATLLPGTIAHDVGHDLPALRSDLAEYRIGIENPAGILEATVVANDAEKPMTIDSVAYRRSAQILLRGHVPLSGASAALVAALKAIGGYA